MTRMSYRSTADFNPNSPFAPSRRWGTLAAMLLAAALLGGALPAPVTAADDGWGLPNLNPFNSKDTKSKSKSTSKSSKSKTPSTWTSVKNGTSNAMTKTKQTLMPWSKPATPTRTSVGSKSKTTPTKKTGGRPEEKSWYEFWKSEPEPKRGPKTVQEFLDQPRPD